MGSKPVMLSYLVDRRTPNPVQRLILATRMRDAVCLLRLQTDKHAIISDENMSLTTDRKENGKVNSKYGEIQVLVPHQRIKDTSKGGHWRTEGVA